MAVKLCGKCGESNSENALMCVVCGSSLKDVHLEGTPNADKEGLSGIKPASTVCKHCNERLEPGLLKCKYCGTVVTKNVPQARYYDNGNSSNFGCAVVLLFIATLLVPLVGLIVGGIFAFSDDVNKQDLGKALLIFGIIIIVLWFLFGGLFI